jgi:dihydroflavonol-4-reductase
MKAFVTGSTGLLGNNLVRLLVEQGYAVKALVRSPEKAAKLFHGLDIELIKGDLLDRIILSKSHKRIRCKFSPFKRNPA